MDIDIVTRDFQIILDNVSLASVAFSLLLSHV